MRTYLPFGVERLFPIDPVPFIPHIKRLEKRYKATKQSMIKIDTP